MPPSVGSPELHKCTQQRADELFEQHQQAIFKSTDRLFSGLMLAQWVAGIFLAFYLSPLTWEGQTSHIHPHVWSAILFGGAISIFPVLLALLYPGTVLTRFTIASAQMLMSGLLIHLTGGRIETHFHIFGSLAFLAFYRDWRVLIPATVVTLLDHFLRGIFWPQSIYGVLTSSPWRTFEHGGWVVFEDVFLIVASLRSVREMRFIASNTAQLETTKQIIEEKVVQRTAEVKASEERFRLLMDGVQDYAIIMLDPQGLVVSWNEGAKRIHGYHADEILGQHFSRFLPYEEMALGKAKRKLEMVITTGRFEDEGWHVRQDGSLFWANVVFTALYDEGGQLRGFSKVTRDATLHKQAEEALQRSHHELEQRVEQRTAELAQANEALQAEIIDHQRADAEIRLKNTLLEAQGEAAIEGILVVSPEGQVLSYNQRLLEMWGIPKSKAERGADQDLLRVAMQKTADPQAFMAKVAYLYDHDDMKSSDEVLLNNGHIFERYSAPLKGADRTYYGRIWFFRDITDSRRAAEALSQAKEEAERANASKSDFLSRMSHELRTPMNAILGFGQLLEMDELSPNQTQAVEQILKAGRHLLELINEVLEIARIEAGRISVSLEPVSLLALLRETCDLVRPLAAQKGVTLTVVCPDNCSRTVLADQQRLKQVVLNLLSNAIKYNVRGGEVTISCEEREIGHLRLQITDTGIGISPQNQAKLFVPFERLGAENTGVEGSGIGLALSKQLITLMRGKIGIESEVGQGSTFWVELLLGQSAELLPYEDKLLIPGVDLEPKRLDATILYIEDNLSNLSLVEGILERRFHTKVLTAMQGSLGLQLARQHQPDLILLDLHLPDVMGDQVLTQLRTDPLTQDIPVIILSADATNRQIQRLLSAGANAYLTKPLDVKQFLDVLEENLGSKVNALVA